MTVVEIALTYSELRLAAEVGVQRQARNLRNNRKDKYGKDPEDGGWTEHINGAAGEMAVARHFNKFWNGALDDLKADDVDRLQVRTGSKHYYGLALHDEDADERRFVLVTGQAPKLTLRGWLHARDGKKPEYWQRDWKRPCYIVPQDKLHPMATLVP